jgi:hypothetical protein
MDPDHLPGATDFFLKRFLLAVVVPEGIAWPSVVFANLVHA